MKRMINCAGELGASAAGSFATGYSESAVMNSMGAHAYGKSSSAALSAVMTCDDGYGYADHLARRVGDINPVEAALEAARKSVQCRNPQAIDPGSYDVVLLPYAVAELLEFLAYTGFGALSVQEERSFMCGKLGERIAGGNICIWDNGADPCGMPSAFDAEGMPKRRVDLIVGGIANVMVYDSFTGNREGRTSTGHATGGTGSFGPMPQNMFMQPGEYSIEEMIESTDRGILVTRFHYTNLLQPIQTLITGMTRDGTFLIESGKITVPLKNLRFTDSILERLSHVEMISHETSRQAFSDVPAIKAKGFRFTGITEF